LVVMFNLLLSRSLGQSRSASEHVLGHVCVAFAADHAPAGLYMRFGFHVRLGPALSKRAAGFLRRRDDGLETPQAARKERLEEKSLIARLSVPRVEGTTRLWGGLSGRIVLAGGSDYNQCFAQARMPEA